jgi:hypothetical protein
MAMQFSSSAPTNWKRVAVFAVAGTVGPLLILVLKRLNFNDVAYRYLYELIAEAVQRVAELPVCNARFGKPLVPYFLPMIVADESAQALLPDGYWYLPEDFSSSERARRAGYKVMADTSIRLGHIGNYEYGWEDVGAPQTRSAGATFRFGQLEAKPKEFGPGIPNSIEFENN